VLYLELLLASKDLDGLTREIAALRSRKVVPDAKFLEIQARIAILKEDEPRAVKLLTAAIEAAEREGDVRTEGTTRSNLVRRLYAIGRLGRDQATQQMAALVPQFPDNDAVAVNYAEIAQRSHAAPVLREALTRLDSGTTAIRHAYLRHQIAVLEGDNDAAGAAAADWLGLEPNNPMAAVAALTAIGIGQERWSEAAIVAEHAIERFPHNQSVINHSAYVLAMSGHAIEAIRLLEPIADENFVLTATFGLAHLANGDIDQGMRLYRDAANTAEKIDPAWRSLMTLYQALIVRQLGLDKALPQAMIDAVALIPFDLPDDWQDRPDFLRLHAICMKNGYGWPISL
jgi:tetratricopeptide (TPR) repeat protein